MARDTLPLPAPDGPSIAMTESRGVFWVTTGGVAPLALMKKYPGRIWYTHLKDMTKGNETGADAKVVLGTGKTLSGRLLIFDALELSWREVALRRNPDCPVCGDEPTQTGLIDYENFCGLSSAAEAEPESSRFDEVNAKELQARLSGPHPPFLLDVREPFEWDIVSLQEDGAVLVPLGELAERLGELPEGRDIVVYCRSGVRSARAAGLLVEAGLGPVSNLVGGVLAWVDEIDPSLPKY